MNKKVRVIGIIYLIPLLLITIISRLDIYPKVYSILSDEWVLDAFYKSKVTEPKFKDLIVFNLEYYNTEELCSLIQYINEFQPKVIAYDEDSDVEIRCATDISCPDFIIPAYYVNQDSIFYSSYQYCSNAYGLVNIRDYYSFDQFSVHKGDSIYDIAVEIVRRYDPEYYESFLSKKSNHQLINYKGNRYEFFSTTFDAYQGDADFIKDKIVILGYLGDDLDVHNTPIGSINGAIIIANKVYTLLGNLLYPVVAFPKNRTV